MVANCARFKVHAIRQDFIDSMMNSLVLANQLALCATTVNKYRKEFKDIQPFIRNILDDFKFRLPKQNIFITSSL